MGFRLPHILDPGEVLSRHALCFTIAREWLKDEGMKKMKQREYSDSDFSMRRRFYLETQPRPGSGKRKKSGRKLVRVAKPQDKVKRRLK